LSNLIISIIAIALAGVMAIAGAWYGSSAFQEAQRKAEINTVITAMGQVASAWRVFAVEHAGNYSDLNETSTYRYITNNFIPLHLSSLPSIPTHILETTSHTSSRDPIFLRASVNFWQASAVYVDSLMISTQKSFCISFAKYVGNDLNDPIRKAGGDRNITSVGEKPVDCFWYDSDGDMVMDEAPTDVYYIIYKVF
jgi:hypothetical protein